MSEHVGSEPASVLRSPLHQRHLALGATLAEFGGWEMPVQYPSGVLHEHAAVRERVGLFDVSHLGTVTVTGPGAAAFLNATLSNDLGKIGPGQAQYTLCLDDSTGGIVDDLIVYLRDEEHLLLVPNAANCAEVVARLRAAAPAGITITDRHRDDAIIAVQGPSAEETLRAAGLPTGHGYLHFVETALGADQRGGESVGDQVVICRTGYTGERGYELIVANEHAVELWDLLLSAGAPYDITPAGLGARDTLRTEMGYPLHGQDIGLGTTPNEARLGWAVGWDKPKFWGRAAVVAEREAGPRRVLRGIVAQGRAIPRPHQQVFLSEHVPVGEVTSGTFSPTLKKGIGMALISTVVHPEADVTVDVRGRREVFGLTQPPFVPSHVREA